jgi:hypothetical protein
MLLLCKAMDFGTLISLVQADDKLTPEKHRFGSLEVRGRIHEALGKWWAGPLSEPCSPVLLAWAAFMALANLISEGAAYPGSSCIAVPARSP